MCFSDSIPAIKKIADPCIGVGSMDNFTYAVIEIAVCSYGPVFPSFSAMYLDQDQITSIADIPYTQLFKLNTPQPCCTGEINQIKVALFVEFAPVLSHRAPALDIGAVADRESTEVAGVLSVKLGKSGTIQL